MAMRASGLGLVVVLCTVAAARGARASDVPVDELNHGFSTQTLHLKVGDAVVFANKDSTPHSLTIIDIDGDATQLAVQPPGKAVMARFADPGQFQIRCTIAPDMRMVVDVGS